MGILLSALAAAGDSGVQSMNQNIDTMNKADLQQQASAQQLANAGQLADLQEKKAETLKTFENTLANAPLTRFAAAAQQQAGQQVPVSAAPVTDTGLTQDSVNTLNLPTGFVGNNAVVGGILATAQQTLQNPQATDNQKSDAQNIIAQIGQQTTAQAGINADAVAGQTRTMTNDEAAQAALSQLKLTDPAAYVAGKAAMGDKYSTLAPGAALYDQTTGKITMTNTQAAEIRAQGLQDRIDMLRDNNENTNETRVQIQQLKDLQANSSGKINNEIGLKYITSLNADMVAEKGLLTSYNNQLWDTPTADIPALKRQIAAKELAISGIQAEKAAWFKGMGITGINPSTTAIPTPTPDPTTTLNTLFPVKNN